MTFDVVCGGGKKQILWSSLIDGFVAATGLRMRKRLLWRAYSSAPRRDLRGTVHRTGLPGIASYVGDRAGIKEASKRNAHAHNFFHPFCSRADADGCAVVGT